MTFTITGTGLLRATCWVLGVGLAVVNIFVSLKLGALATCFVAVAAVLTIRGFIDAHAGNWTTAYEMGREVSKMRRIP